MAASRWRSGSGGWWRPTPGPGGCAPPPHRRAAPRRRRVRGGAGGRGRARARPAAAALVKQPARLLIRDLAQLATPAGSAAPLRRGALAGADVVDGAFVRWEEGRISAVGRMRDLPPLDGEVEELDASGRCAIPGLVDCHTHACFLGDRVDEFALRAAGASYEE